LWLENPNRAIANTQFVIYRASAAGVSVRLFLLYGGILPEPMLSPILGIASAGVLLGTLLMLYMVVRSRRAVAEGS
jgi:hypothetical protein